MVEYLASTAASTLAVMRYVLPSIFVGLFIANILSARSFFASRGARFIPALSGFSGLPSAGVVAILLSIGDRTAGLAALSMARKREGLADATIVASCLAMKAPSAIQSLFLSFLPIMIAMFPAAIVGKFLALYYACFVCITAAGIALARRRIGARGEASLPSSPISMNLPPMGKSLALAFRGTIPAFLNIAAWLLGMSFLASIIARSGLLGGLSGILPIPARQLPYAAAGLVSIFGGIGAAGVAFRDGLLGQSELLPLFFATALIHNIYDFFASLLPLHVSMFGRGLGSKTAGTLSLATVASIVAIMALLGAFGY
jgi:hypothetical protein